MKKLLFTLILITQSQLVLAGKTGSGGASSADAKQVTHIPTTVSAEVRGGLAFFNSVGQKLFKLPADFDLKNLDMIKDLNREKCAELSGMNQPVLDEYRPVITKKVIGTIPIVDIAPSDWEDTKNARLAIFLHGGGYVIGSAESYLVGPVIISHELKARVISVDYTTAPFAQYDEIIGQVISVIKALLDEGYTMDNIAIFGDSAGGGLAAATILKMRDLEMKLPAALALWSPWLDLTRAGDTKETLDEHDPILDQAFLDECALAYAPEFEHKNPLVSPVYADFSYGDFPPTLVQGGTKEIFMSDWVRFCGNINDAEEARERKGLAPLYVKLDLTEGVTHCFHIFMHQSPEAKKALGATKRFFEKYVSSVFADSE